MSGAGSLGIECLVLKAQVGFANVVQQGDDRQPLQLRVVQGLAGGGLQPGAEGGQGGEGLEYRRHVQTVLGEGQPGEGFAGFVADFSPVTGPLVHAWLLACVGRLS